MGNRRRCGLVRGIRFTGALDPIFVCVYLWLGVAVEDHGIAEVDLDGEPKLSLPVSRKLCSDTLNM